MTKAEFVKNPKLCPPLVLDDEDQPQDKRDWERMVREHEDRLYAAYQAQFESEEPKVVSS